MAYRTSTKGTSAKFLLSLDHHISLYSLKYYNGILEHHYRLNPHFLWYKVFMCCGQIYQSACNTSAFAFVVDCSAASRHHFPSQLLYPIRYEMEESRACEHALQSIKFEWMSHNRGL